MGTHESLKARLALTPPPRRARSQLGGEEISGGLYFYIIMYLQCL